MTYRLFTDGGSRGNPGNAACAAFLFGEQNSTIDFCAEYLGICTNNVAEYTGLLKGIKTAKKCGNFSKLEIFMDSELIVKQIRGEYKISNEDLGKLAKKVKDELNGLNYEINHIPREQNKLADKLVNTILDSVSQLRQ